MAIGKLPAGTLITTATTSVTFQVAAIESGVSSDLTKSSFLTAALDIPSYSNVDKDYTDIIDDQRILNEYFFAFKLKEKVSAIKAEYKFSLHSGSFSDYGLLVAAKGVVEKKHPSYTMPSGGNVNTNSIIILDQRTEVTMVNNQTVGDLFDPVVDFTFNTNVGTGTIGGSIFALVFEIPVYALVTECRWYIKPGYGVLQYELDDGLGGIGGAVLIRTGNPEVHSPSGKFKIEIKVKPRKWRYRWAGAPGEGSNVWEYDRVFDVVNLRVQLQHEDGSPYTDHPLASDGSGIIDDTVNAYLNNSKLTYLIGGERVTPGSTLKPEFYGLVEVVVRFTEPYSGISKEDKFYILVSGRYSGAGNNSTDAFDYANLSDITNNIITVNDANDFMSAMQEAAYSPASTAVNRIRIVMLNASINISESSFNLNPGNSSLIIIMAKIPNIRLGRGLSSGTLGNQIKFQGTRSGLAAFYFGKWPFAGLTGSPTTLNTTYHFSVNAAGTISTTNASSFPREYTNKMIVDSAAGGGIYNVDLDGPEGVTVYFSEDLH